MMSQGVRETCCDNLNYINDSFASWSQYFFFFLGGVIVNLVQNYYFYADTRIHLSDYLFT